MTSSILRQSTTESSSILTNLTWFVNEFANSSLNQSFGHWVRQFLTQFVNSSISSAIRHWVRELVTEFVNSLKWLRQYFFNLVRQRDCQFVPYSIIWSLSSSIRHWVRHEFVNEFANTSSIHCTESSSILTNLTWFVDNFINPALVYWFHQLVINLARFLNEYPIIRHRTQFVTGCVNWGTSPSICQLSSSISERGGACRGVCQYLVWYCFVFIVDIF